LLGRRVAPRVTRTAAWPARLGAWTLALPLCAPWIWLFASWARPESEIWSHLQQHVLGPVVANTIALCALVGAGVSVLGIGLAWLSARCEYPGRRWLDWALVLPLAMPGYVAAFAYVGLFDYAGPVQGAWRALSGSRLALPDARTLGGAALVLTLVLYPYVYLLVRAAFLRQGAAAFDAARTLGRTPSGAFVRVALPLARPAWIAGLTLALLETLGDFGAVSVLGIDTFTTAIYKTWFGLYSIAGAAQLACLLLLGVALVLVLERGLRSRVPLGERSARPMPRIALRGGRALAATTFAATIFALGFLLPLLRLLQWASQARIAWRPLLEVAMNTLLLGTLVAAVVVALGLALALLERARPRDRWVQWPVFASTLGYAVPGTVIAVATMLGLLGLERAVRDASGWNLVISSTLVATVAALALRFVRVGHGSAEAGLRSLRPAVIDSARMLEASPWRRLRRVILPLLRPSLIAALLLAGVETMKELPATLMLRPFGWDTLAVKIHGYTSEGLWQEAAWPAVLLVAVGLLPVRWLIRSQR
jgi:iron(III) transport system permease protein